MDTISTLDDEPSLNRRFGCLWSVFLAGGTDRWRGRTLVLGSPSWVGSIRPSIWSNSMTKASLEFSNECRGYGPSLGAIGHKSRSPDAGRLRGLPDVHLCQNSAWPVLQSSGRHNFVIRTMNWVNQNSIHVS